MARYCHAQSKMQRAISRPTCTAANEIETRFPSARAGVVPLGLEPIFFAPPSTPTWSACASVTIYRKNICCSAPAIFEPKKNLQTLLRAGNFAGRAATCHRWRQPRLARTRSLQYSWRTSSKKRPHPNHRLRFSRRFTRAFLIKLRSVCFSLAGRGFRLASVGRSWLAVRRL